MEEIISAFWFFLPAFVANQCPGFARWAGIPPVTISRRLLGGHKTIDAYLVGFVGAYIAVDFQQSLHSFNTRHNVLFADTTEQKVLYAFLFGCGAVVGDHLKSYFKRRRGIPPGSPWWPYDQLDFAVAALIAILPFSGWIGVNHIVIILVVSVLFHPVVNWVGWKVGIRKTWK
ncbi:CDP-archaeol synthase [bacterium]|nr:CDP-archaeol synthase [bacterium]